LLKVVWLWVLTVCCTASRSCCLCCIPDLLQHTRQVPHDGLPKTCLLLGFLQGPLLFLQCTQQHRLLLQAEDGLLLPFRI
jgi:hypothetical protein